MRKRLKAQVHLLTFFLLAFFACQSEKSLGNQDERSVVEYVNPFIGTDGHGHTFPGAARPYAMVQLSPDTYNAGWDWCSGYHYSDRSIMGFSHTHLSGTGRSDLMDILLMPTVGKVQMEPGSRAEPDKGYRSRFTKEKETASPGYYAVTLEDYGVDVELTTTQRVGFHRYTFPESAQSNIIIDLFHGRQEDSVLLTGIRVINDSLITGFRTSKGWGEPGEEFWSEHTIYFAALLNKPFSNALVYNNQKHIPGIQEAEGDNVKLALQFQTQKKESILVKVGISAVDIEGAINNLKEIPHWDFNLVRNESKKQWDALLKRVEIEGGAPERLEVFYTAMYHSLLAPYLFSDLDGRYRGSDKTIQQANGIENYTVFSLWDTFRALHPLLTILQPKRVNDLITSMLRQYEEYGLLPVWSLHGSETNCMIGYHSIPVIVDAYFKGIRDFDVELAYEAMKKSAMQNQFGIDHLKNYGYIPRDKLIRHSVAMTLEYAFDDWCVAQMAKALGKVQDEEYFSKRAEASLNLLDTSTGFMRGKYASGEWNENFDPYNANNASSDFIEGNSWQYTWFVPHNIEGLIAGMGGKQRFSERLDSLFTVSSALEEGTPIDVTGLIGQYAHGNEPSHHVAYLFNEVGEAWKTQFWLDSIANSLYDNSPAGLCGNEDCGQMSAWYVLTSMGFYPINPASGIYHIGKPFFPKMSIHLPDNKQFVITAEALNQKNKYIQSAQLNGQPLKRAWIKHEELIKGGTLHFIMGESPNKNLWN